MVGAGSVVTRNVPPNAIVVGNPARIKDYVSANSQKTIKKSEIPSQFALHKTNVPGVDLYKLPLVTDMRGQLTFGEYDQHLPFLPKRFFVIINVPGKEVRGEHCHKELQEFLVCLQGSVRVVADDGVSQDDILLDDPTLGLYLPSGIWTVQYHYSSDAILLVLASDVYVAEDYIRNYDEFLTWIKTSKPD